MSLVEFVVAATLLVVLLTAILEVHAASVKSQNNSVSRALTTQDVSAGAERLTREIRNASAVTVVNSAKIDLLTPVRGGAASSALRHVVYDCSASQRCNRQEGPVGGSLSSRTEPILQGVENGDIFTGTPGATNPRYVAVKLDVSVGAARPVQFQDGVTVRGLSS